MSAEVARLGPASGLGSGSAAEPNCLASGSDFTSDGRMSGVKPDPQRDMSGVKPDPQRDMSGVKPDPQERMAGVKREVLARVLICCGGTGGHLTPGIALAEELLARGYRPTLLISEKRVDGQLAAKYPHFEFLRLPGAPLAWHPAKLLRFFNQQLRGLVFAWRQVGRARPAAVVGFGGFTSAAMIVVGAARGVPVALHEANRVPGRAIRWLAPLARRVYVPAGVALGAARRGAKHELGLPVRREIRAVARADACAAFGFDPTLPVVTVLGGSQGATALNQWAQREAARLAGRGIQLCCVTGGQGEAEVQSHAGSNDRAVRALYLPFCDRMAVLLSATSLAVSRAGAGTIAELVRCRTPSILVPYPHAVDNHQAANAARLHEQEGAWVLPQHEVANRLTAEVLERVQNEELLERTRANLARLDEVDAAAAMADDVLTMAGLPRTAMHGEERA
jgi:UDP-N-acetylglucosamine--N-acetylmuramyl-(pentapeptide) pyrophosphoryl-undecaprenol N-acetylglucosamine transferase